MSAHPETYFDGMKGKLLVEAIEKQPHLAAATLEALQAERAKVQRLREALGALLIQCADLRLVASKGKREGDFGAMVQARAVLKETR